MYLTNLDHNAERQRQHRSKLKWWATDHCNRLQPNPLSLWLLVVGGSYLVLAFYVDSILANKWLSAVKNYATSDFQS